MASYRYTLGPLDWHADGYWQHPAGSQGMLDLRGLPACGEAGTAANRQVAFCWWPDGATIPASHATLNAAVGDLRDINATTTMRDAFLLKCDYRPALGNGKIVDLLADLLTNGSVPDASGTVPTLESSTIHLPDHSPVWTAPANWRSLGGFSQWNNRYDSRQQGKVTSWIAAEDGGLLPPGTAAKALGGMLLKHGVNGSGRGQSRRWSEAEWQRFVAPSQRAKMRSRGGPKPPSTTVSDNFDRADGAVGSPWAGDTSRYTIESNRLRVGTGVEQSHLYYGTPLSDDDMDTQVTHISNLSGIGLYAGPTVRHSNSAATYYLFAGSDGYKTVYKRVAGTRTQLTAGSGTGVDDGDVALLSIVGSTLTGKRNGTTCASITDTAISGNLYAGMAKAFYLNAYGLYDAWSATDNIPDAPTAPTVDTLSTTDTTPTLTGTFTASETDTLSLIVDGVTYDDEDFVKDGDSWSLTLTTPLDPGTYSVTLTASNAGGDTDDATSDELTVEELPTGGIANIPFHVANSAKRTFRNYYY